MKKLLVFFTSLLFANGFAQNQQQSPELDSLTSVLKKQKGAQKAETLNEISDFYFHKDPDLGIKYADQAYALSDQSDFGKGKAKAMLNKGKHLMIKGEYDKSLAALSKSKEISEQIKDDCSVGTVFLETGTVYGNVSKFPEALDASFQALRHLENCPKDLKTLAYTASCYQNIANIYNATESFEKALEYYDKARNEWKLVPHEEVSVAMNLASKGIVYEKQGKFQEALKVYREAISQLEPLQQAVPLAFVNSWLGETYLSLKEYDKSIECSQKAFEVISQIGDQDLMASTIQNIGSGMLMKGINSNDRNLATQGFEKVNQALEQHKVLGNHEGIISDYDYISRYYKFVGNYPKALEAYEKWAIYKDSVFNFKNKQTLQNLEDQRTIEIRNKELQISKLTIENKEKQKWFLIAGIALFAVIGILLYNRSRNRRRTNEKLQALNAELYEADRVKTRFFSILNHDLRAPVARLISFLKLQKENPELLDDESKERMEKQTMSSAENLLESMEDMLLWTKGQMEHFSPKPRLVLVSNAFGEIEQYFAGEKIAFSFEDNGVSLETDPDYLKTILRNLTSNAIKALGTTENPAISWKAWQEKGKTLLSISDNGPGASQEKFRALYDETEVVGIKTGLGLHLIRDLAQAIDCGISVSSEEGKGTTFTLRFG